MRLAPRTRTRLRRIALVAFAAYALQAAAVTCAYLVPQAHAIHDGSRYEIKRGYGYGFDYVPLLGVVPLVSGEPCRLVITDLRTGARTVRDYDLAIDIYADYTHVWPEKQS